MVKTLLLVSMELLSLVALWRAGVLLDPDNPIDKLMTILRIVALAWMAWTTYSTIAMVSSDRPRFTNRLSRRLAHRAVAAAIVTGVAATPTPVLALAAQVDSAGAPIPPGAFVRAGPIGRSATTESAALVTAVEVRPGDNLWRISERRVRSAETDPTPGRIATYWVNVVAINRGHLRSGNPDLIYPGEVIELPPA